MAIQGAMGRGRSLKRKPSSLNRAVLRFPLIRPASGGGGSVRPAGQSARPLLHEVGKGPEGPDGVRKLASLAAAAHTSSGLRLPAGQARGQALPQPSFPTRERECARPAPSRRPSDAGPQLVVGGAGEPASRHVGDYFGVKHFPPALHWRDRWSSP